MPTPASIGHSKWRTKAIRSACIAILLGMALISAPGPAFGDYPTCMANCSYQCRASGSSGCLTPCYANCRVLNPDKPLPPAPYGAIAFGDQGAEGMSWNQTTPADADRVALNLCGRYGMNGDDPWYQTWVPVEEKDIDDLLKTDLWTIHAYTPRIRNDWRRNGTRESGWVRGEVEPAKGETHDS